MLSIAKTLKGYQLHGLDGEIGRVKEFYFDDLHWTVRYLVAETGNWLTGRQVHYDRLGYWLDEPAGERYLARI